MNTHFTKQQPCPACDKELDATTGVSSDKAPGEDDITVCVYCRSILRFGPDLRLVIVTSEEISKYPLNIQVQLAVIQTACRKAETRDSS